MDKRLDGLSDKLKTMFMGIRNLNDVLNKYTTPKQDYTSVRIVIRIRQHLGIGWSPIPNACCLGAAS